MWGDVGRCGERLPHDELLLDERAQLHEHLHAQRLQLRLGLARYREM